MYAVGGIQMEDLELADLCLLSTLDRSSSPEVTGIAVGTCGVPTMGEVQGFNVQKNYSEK